jgi:hypothetical protein
MFCTGGLEYDSSDVTELDGIQYVFSNKFKQSLKNIFIDWGTFLDMYKNNIDYVTMYEQINRIINLKNNENLKETMVPALKKIYHLPASVHMLIMIKQFMLYEPVSISIKSIFLTIKKHYEDIVLLFLKNRNKYITINDLPDKKNDITRLISTWTKTNDDYDLQTSSIILFFLNPPEEFNNELEITISSIKKTKKLLKKINKFTYPGFCPKVPHERLKKLLEFPVESFIKIIKKMDSNIKFPNYSEIENIIHQKLKELPAKAEIDDNFIRLDPPAHIKDNIKICEWYVTQILDLRKSFIKEGIKYESYYVEYAKILDEINNILKHELKKMVE